jgi:hypothetical protein
MGFTSNDKKVRACTRFVTDAGTNLTLWSKFKVKGHQQWYTAHRQEVVYLHAKYEKPVLNQMICRVPLLATFDLELRPQGQTGPCVHNKSCPGCN